MDLFREDMIHHSAIAAGIVVAFIILAFLVRSLLGIVGRRLVAKTVNAFDDKILEVILRHIRPLMIVAGLQIAVREIRKGVLPVDVTALQIIDYTEQILYLVTVVIIVKVILGILREFINWYLDRISSDGAANLKLTLGPLSNKVIDILIGIVNYAFPLKPMRVFLKFDVAYGTDPAKVRQILTSLAGANPGILHNPAPQVFLTAVTDAAVQFTLVARASEYGEQYAVETMSREQAYLAFMQDGIAVQVARRIVHMKATA